MYRTPYGQAMLAHTSLVVRSSSIVKWMGGRRDVVLRMYLYMHAGAYISVSAILRRMIALSV